MRKFIFAACAALLLGGSAGAQHISGGIPWSYNSGTVGQQNISKVIYPAPDYAAAQKEDEKGSIEGYRVGLMVDANVDFNNAGTFSYLQNGNRVWRMVIGVEGAKAIDLFMDRFYLPQGVSMFVSNANGKQLIGAYTNLSNLEDGVFTTPSVQGSEVVVELNIESWVNLADIKFHVNQVAASYRGGMANNLNLAFGLSNSNQVEARPTYEGQLSDLCHINAACPDGDGYNDLKQTTIHSSYPRGAGLYFCSGNLINNTAKDCKPYYLTASHCEATNSKVNSGFATWKFYFNYKTATCSAAPGTAPMTDVITGANFVARSDYDASVSWMIGDFLLLQLKDELNDIGKKFNGYLAGWDRASTTPVGKLIGFHHPAGDPMKLSIYTRAFSNGNFNGGAPSSHWSCKLEKGGMEGGSSGSGIFSMATKRLIGDLSGGPDFSPCDTIDANRSEYSKFTLNWEYENGGDGTPKTRLKDHLDPANTGATFTETIKVGSGATPDVGCGEGSTANDDVEKLSNAISVYPSPSTTGQIKLKVNLERATDLNISVVNLLGAQVGSFLAKSIGSGEVAMDLGHVASGVYIININVGTTVISKKVVITK